jgi:hypothetical protein
LLARRHIITRIGAASKKIERRTILAREEEMEKTRSGPRNNSGFSHKMGILGVPILFIAALTVALSTSPAQAISLATPSVTVTGVSATSNPVCQVNNPGGNTAESVSATVTPTYDSGSGPTTTTTCAGKKQTVKTVTVTVSNQSLSATDKDSNGNGPDPMSGSSPGGGGFTDSSLPVGPEGSTTVTVAATASDTVTTTTTTTVNTFSSAGCTGTETPGTPSTTSSSQNNSASASNSASYIVDLTGPVANNEVLAQPSVTQAGTEILGIDLDNGSALTNFSVSVTATGVAGDAASGPTILTTSDSGTFGHKNPDDGTAPTKHVGPIGLATQCDTPTGSYDVQVTPTTIDLCAPDLTNALDPSNSSDLNFGLNRDGTAAQTAPIDLGTFDVTPGISLSAQTGVLAEFTTGDYGVDQCFTSTSANTAPGTVHIDTIINTTGPCAGFGTISGVTATLTLPATGQDQDTSSTVGDGFVYAISGKSPPAHVFIGNVGGGGGSFDLHNGTPLVEVTGEVKQTPAKQLAGGGGANYTDTLDLSKVNLDDFPALVTANGGPFGLGPGVFPANFTIFIRAHAKYQGSLPSPPDTVYSFASSASANSSAGALSNNSTYSIDGDPNYLLDPSLFPVVNGNQTTQCNVNGIFQ